MKDEEREKMKLILSKQDGLILAIVELRHEFVALRKFFEGDLIFLSNRAFDKILEKIELGSD